MPSLVKDGQTSILVPLSDVGALSSAIQTLWTQPDLAAKMGQAGRKHIESNFNPKVINSNISDMLDKIYRTSIVKGEQ